MKRIEVVAAAIFNEHRLYATQRGYGQWAGWWEFPGGKVEKGEALVEALRRELREELNLEVQVHEKIATIDYDYTEFHLTMHLYRCTPQGMPTLIEHRSARWLTREEVGSIEWLPADQEVIPKVAQLF